MTIKPASFKVQVFFPELPKPEGEHLFRALQADDSADAIRRALAAAFAKTGHLPNRKPKRLFIIAECLDGDTRGPT